jgi:hypothetical protein
VVKPRPIPELAARAEQVLLPVVRAGSDPVSYGWLAERITEPGEAPLPPRLMGQVLTHLRDQGGTWSWSPRLTAFVVSAETGEPGVGYFVPELADAAAIREQTHRRVVAGVYDSGE